MTHAEPTIGDHAELGRQALTHYAKTHKVNVKLEGADTIISDIIADLMHYANSIALDAEAIVERAQMNYQAEIEEAAELR